MNRVVFDLHRVGERGDIGLVAFVISIGQEDRDDAGRGRAHENVGRLHLRRRGFEVGDLASSPERSWYLTAALHAGRLSVATGESQ